MKAYESFLKKAGTPIGIVGAVILLSWGVGRFFDLPENENVWNAQCEQLAVGNTIQTDTERMGGQHFCVKLTPMENYPIRHEYTWKAGCAALGGIYKSSNSRYTCYKEEVVEELGARETYSP